MTTCLTAGLPTYFGEICGLTQALVLTMNHPRTFFNYNALNGQNLEDKQKQQVTNVLWK